MVDSTDQAQGIARPAPARRVDAVINPFTVYILAPALTYALILYTAQGDATIAILTSMATLILYWIGFSRANPRLVGLELIGVILLTYYTVHPPMAVLWVAASAVGAAAGTWLQFKNGNESDFYFLIPPAAALSFVFLVWLGAGASLSPALTRAGHELVQARREMFEMAKAIETQKPEQGRVLRETLEELKGDVDVLIVNFLLVVWTFGLWVAGRVSRAFLGQLGGRRHSLAFFRIDERYIFLLIVGLVLEILNGLAPRWGMQWLAIPLLAVFSLAGFIEGVAVVLFYGAVQRFKGQRWGGHLWNVAGLVLAIRLPFLAVLVGLSDVWFDYRRLHGLRQRIDYQA